MTDSDDILPMSEERLIEIESIESVTSDAPWDVLPSGRHIAADVVWHAPGKVTYTPIAEAEFDHPESEIIARFIAVARTAVPQMATEIRRLRARNAELTARVDWLCALESAGVDNWEGCSQAAALLREWEEEDNDNGA